MSSPSISVCGLGYVGLSTAVCFASRGFKVIGVDVDEQKVKLINSGQPLIYEPSLRELLAEPIEKGLLSCTLDYKHAISESRTTFITVGTPAGSDGSIDLRNVEDSSRQIGRALRDQREWHLVVVRSTVTPGTTSQLVKPIIETTSGKKCGVDWGLCMNPEFLREGSAVKDTFKPDRIVIGEHDRTSGDRLENLYRQFYGEQQPPILRMSPVNAEFVKYANNAFLAMKVSYINMIANLCQKISGADILQVAKAIGLDKRIGPLFLEAGLGYGGSCFPKDLKALLDFAKKKGIDAPLIESTIRINESQPLKALEMAEQILVDLEDKRIAVLGLAFKPNTDDLREAVSIRLINALLEKRAKVVAYDPIATDNARRILGDKVLFASSALDCIDGADSCIVVTEWDEFRKLRPEDFERMRNPVVIDGRRIFDPQEFKRVVRFEAIGLGATSMSPSE